MPELAGAAVAAASLSMSFALYGSGCLNDRQIVGLFTAVISVGVLIGVMTRLLF